MSDENEDKKVIGDEEREKMLNKENVAVEDNRKIEEIEKVDKEKELDLVKENGEVEKESGVVKSGEVEKIKKELEDSQKEQTKVRVPIGGIQLVGFFRSRSKDKNKENEGTTEEGVDLLETSAQKPEKNESGLRATLARGLDTLAARNPFARKEQPAQDPADVEANDAQQQQQRPKLMSRLSRPLAIVLPVLPKRFKRSDKDQKDGADGVAVDPDDKQPSSPDDGMESVKLDMDGDAENAEKEGLAGDAAKVPIYLQWRDRAMNSSRHEKILAAAIIFSILFLIILIAAVSGTPMPTAPPVVNGKVITTTQCGAVEGTQKEEAFVFYGIPYAVPPVGNRRWKPAQPLNSLDLCWDDTVYKAENSSITRQCWQEEDGDRINGFEDCLYLDIWTPEVRYINPLPVVVLIDTATLLGGNSEILTPTSKLVHSREVIFVRPNFRLGVFGFLAAAPLSGAVYPPTSGNYGLSDLLVALQWVKTNIGHFGGDPDQVTILGHRAGATLATVLSVTPLAKGLFQRAWVTSGSAMFPGEVLQLAENKSQNFVNELCPEEENQDKRTQYDCLLKQGPETLMGAIENDWRAPASDLPKSNHSNETKHDWIVLDGHILREHVWSALSSRHADLVIGTTAHSEATKALHEEIDRDGNGHSEAIVKRVRESALGAGEVNLAEEAISRYNATWEGFASMITDIRTVCPLLAMARTQSNITFYVATQRRTFKLPGSLADINIDLSAILGTYTPNVDPQKSFVKTMQDTFFNFVNDGVLPALPSPAPVMPVLTIGREAEWRNEYPNCGFWVAKNFTPLYARRD